eukprot:2145107-Rhodomonas_salina.1
MKAAEGKLEAATAASEGKLEAATNPEQKELAQKACDRADRAETAYNLTVENVNTARENVNTARENINRAGRAMDITLDALQRAGA